MHHENLASALEALRREGMGWVSFVPAAEGPDPALCTPLGADAGVLLLLSFGSSLAMGALDARAGEADPIDTHSLGLADTLRAAALPAETRVVYPGAEVALDLRGWVQAAGAQYPSPLGTGVRPDTGPWLAVRAALVTRLVASERELVASLYPRLAAAASPCVRCVDTPCVRACPVGAVGAIGEFDLHACVEHRLREGSGCASRCPARLACPMGERFRYAPRALDYHYGVSLRMLQAWRADAD